MPFDGQLGQGSVQQSQGAVRAMLRGQVLVGKGDDVIENSLVRRNSLLVVSQKAGKNRAQDLSRLILVEFRDPDASESTGECRIGSEPAAFLVGGGSDDTEVTARQSRFERLSKFFVGAGTVTAFRHQLMDLVDEQDDPVLRILGEGNQRLDLLLHHSAIHRSRDQGGQIQLVDRLVA